MKYCVTVSKLIVDDDNLIRADGVVLGRRVQVDGQAYLQLKDRDRLRSQKRGTVFVHVPIKLIEQLDK